MDNSSMAKKKKNYSFSHDQEKDCPICFDRYFLSRHVSGYLNWNLVLIKAHESEFFNQYVIYGVFFLKIRIIVAEHYRIHHPSRLPLPWASFICTRLASSV